MSNVYRILGANVCGHAAIEFFDSNTNMIMCGLSPKIFLSWALRAERVVAINPTIEGDARKSGSTRLSKFSAGMGVCAGG